MMNMLNTTYIVVMGLLMVVLVSISVKAGAKGGQIKQASGLPIANMLPVSLKSAIPHVTIDSFASTRYCLVRTFTLDPESSSGLDDRLGMWMTALRGAASFDEIKDWGPDEQLAAVTYVNKLFKFVFEAVAQRNLRWVCAHYCSTLGDDTKAVWSDEGWNTFISVMSRVPIPLLAPIINLVELMQPMVRYAEPLPLRSLNPGFMLYWLPETSLADMLDYRAELLQNLEGMNWFRKIRIPFASVPLGPILVKAPRMIRVGPTNEWMFWFDQSPIIQDVGGTPTWFYQDGSPVAGEITSTKYYFLPGTEPWPLYSLKALMHPYNVTNNPLGCLDDLAAENNIPGLTYANDKMRIACISFADTDTTISLLANADVEDLNWAFACLADTDTTFSELVACGFWHQTTGVAVWTYACENALTTLWRAARTIGPVPRSQVTQNEEREETVPGTTLRKKRGGRRHQGRRRPE